MLALTVILFGVVAVFVDLKPRVDENFFSANDASFRRTPELTGSFHPASQLIVSATSPCIS